MTPWLEDPDVTLYHGDVLATLRELPAESVDCVVTSPPYWGLRDYGAEGQLGLEPTPEQYVERMVEVFREVRRVLAAHGTVWLNLGDSYAGSGKGGQSEEKRSENWQPTYGPPTNVNKFYGLGRKHRLPYGYTGPPPMHALKPKDLVGIPWRVAFALQADGWYLRSDIIWSKPNPMPESVTDRPTKAHEYVFLLSKQPRYFFDQEAVREAWSVTNDRGDRIGFRGNDSYTAGRSFDNDGERIAAGGNSGDGAARGPDGRKITRVVGRDGSAQHRDGERWPNGGRNIRSVWEIATQPYPEAHFATFPEELARRCIAAGCPEGGTVLDPFVGSGTVCYVARKLGRHAVGIDLSAEYLALAARRLQQQSLFAVVPE